MTGDELAEQVHRLSASDLLRGRVAAVAINPMDHHVLAARRPPPIYDPPELDRPLRVAGWPICKTRNVPEGQVRLIPPGRLEPRSENLDPAFDHRHAERLARRMGDVITRREGS